MEREEGASKLLRGPHFCRPRVSNSLDKLELKGFHVAPCYYEDPLWIRLKSTRFENGSWDPRSNRHESSATSTSLDPVLAHDSIFTWNLDVNPDMCTWTQAGTWSGLSCGLISTFIKKLIRQSAVKRVAQTLQKSTRYFNGCKRNDV